MDLLTINDAAALAQKSIQTMRRMIKQKKLAVRKQKTPQGFNYLIVKASLFSYINQRSQPPTQGMPYSQDAAREHKSLDRDFEQTFQTEVERFNATIQKLIEQNEKDKENFFQLIRTFQNRVLTLEDQIKLLEGPKPQWWQIWK